MLDIKINAKELEDKILACWIGKNIGGTMGAPYEWETKMLDINGYSTPKGEPLPNDDLDLQLAWLWTLERSKIKHLDANILGKSWQRMISPDWNEYGIGKKNLDLGLLPPLSGEFENDKWKHSNGAWIRTELWACLSAGFPNVAIKYAIMDASVDHGLGEGTYAAVFTAALESIAFHETNIRTIVEKALEFIPDNCRVAQCVRIVLKEYDNKTPYRETREKIVEATRDLGWFQAPLNIGFTTIGLIYGEGDFKKSMIYAINCGDDTDCTGGTVGAVLGIVGGTEAIPSDWRGYIGDRIIQLSINGLYDFMLPKTCTELTQRVIKLIPEIFKTVDIDSVVEFGESDNFDKDVAYSVLEGYSDNYFKRSRFSFDISNYLNVSAMIEYDKPPVIKEFEDFHIKVTFKNIAYEGDKMQCSVKMILPDGWTADYRKNVHVVRDLDLYTTKEQNISGETQNEYHYTVTANENIVASNRVYIMLESPNLCAPFVIPIILLG